MAEGREARRPSGGLGEGIRMGIGILAAVKETIEETIQEAVERGDLSPERAGQVMRETAKQVQIGLEDARDRFDLVPRADFDRLRTEVEDLRRRVEEIETGGESPPVVDISQIPLDVE